MSTLTPGPRRRSRRAERAGDMFRPEEQAGMETYQAENENPPEDASDFSQDAPQMEEPDWSAYYRRPSEETENETSGEPEYAYAPPVRLRHFGYGKGQAARSRSSFRWKMQTMGKRRTLRSRARRCTIPDRSRGTSLYRKRKNTRSTALKRRKKRNFPTGHGGRSSAKESSSAAPCWFWPGQDMPFGSRCQSGSAA